MLICCHKLTTWSMNWINTVFFLSMTYKVRIIKWKLSSLNINSLLSKPMASYMSLLEYHSVLRTESLLFNASFQSLLKTKIERYFSLSR